MSNPFHKKGSNAPAFLSRFDSASDMVTGLSSFHDGKVFRKVNKGGQIYSGIINALPPSWRKKLYSYGGLLESTSMKNLHKIDAEEISRWIYQSYPERTWPAIAIGSSNGALSHLYAALNIPWLPQTFLVPIKKDEAHSIDKPEDTIRWSENAGAIFLKNNPGWHLSQMMDPVQDRVRAGLIAYFRIKKQSLAYWYKKFILERLQHGGTIFIADCKLKWPVVTLGDNHTFQFGGLGTYKSEEYYYGSKRIHAFLREVNSEVKSWAIPKPDKQMSEAEWGFDENLTAEILELAKTKGYKVSKITFTHPQGISSNIADIYREWYKNNKQISDRLLVESFTVHSPLLTIETSSVPYWLFFNSEDAAAMMENYIDGTEPFDEIFMMILSHGKTLGGVTSIRKWESILSKARKSGQFVGMDKNEYPLDLGIFTRYTHALEKAITDRYPIQQISMNDFQGIYSKFLKGDGAEISSLVI